MKVVLRWRLGHPWDTPGTPLAHPWHTPAHLGMSLGFPMNRVENPEARWSVRFLSAFVF